MKKLGKIKKRVNNLGGEYLYGTSFDRDYYESANDDVEWLVAEVERLQKALDTIEIEGG